ncbi:MAG: hypothetical protein MRZ39_08505 [Oscillospiraceae bacterium]|nr:hypothetical protein [Oscillospiraceae bacterium]
MKIKKIVAAIAAAAVAVSTMAVSAFAAQNADSFADGTAYLNINDSEWSDFDATWENVQITGDGDYTVSMTGADGIALAQFNALEVKNGETFFNRTYTITVTSIMINGTEQKIADGYTCSADGNAINTRVNLYNEWNSPSEEVSDDGNVDCRAADGDFMSKSATMIDSSCLEAGTNDIVVKFTVAGTGVDAAADTTADTTDAAETTETTSTATGNASAAAIAAVMAAAGVAAIAAKKRK